MMNRVAQIVGYIVLAAIVVALLVGYGFCRGRYDFVPRGSSGPAGPMPTPVAGPTHVVIDGDVPVRLAAPLVVERERTIEQRSAVARPAPVPKRPRSMTTVERERWRIAHDK